MNMFKDLAAALGIPDAEEGLDLYRTYAAKLYAVPYDEVTAEQRHIAKEHAMPLVWTLLYSAPTRRLNSTEPNRQEIPKDPARCTNLQHLVAKGSAAAGKAPRARMRGFLVAGPELDAILAGLRLLAREVVVGNVTRSLQDPIGNIWTDSGAHAGLSTVALHALADRLNRGES